MPSLVPSFRGLDVWSRCAKKTVLVMSACQRDGCCHAVFLWSLARGRKNTVWTDERDSGMNSCFGVSLLRQDKNNEF
jgi:hypothetical protein